MRTLWILLCSIGFLSEAFCGDAKGQGSNVQVECDRVTKELHEAQSALDKLLEDKRRAVHEKCKTTHDKCENLQKTCGALKPDDKDAYGKCTKVQEECKKFQDKCDQTSAEHHNRILKNHKPRVRESNERDGEDEEEDKFDAAVGELKIDGAPNIPKVKAPKLLERDNRFDPSGDDEETAL